MLEKTPKPKLVVKQPTKDVRVIRAGTELAAKKTSAKKAAPAKKATFAKKAAR